MTLQEKIAQARFAKISGSYGISVNHAQDKFGKVLEAAKSKQAIRNIYGRKLYTKEELAVINELVTAGDILEILDKLGYSLVEKGQNP